MKLLSWITGRADAATSPSTEPVPGPFRGVRTLRPGEGWRSTNGRSVLGLCSRGKLTLKLDGKVQWRPASRGRAIKLLLDGRGLLTLFDKDSEPLWRAGTLGMPDVELHIQDDGNAVLYSGHHVLWFSDTRL